METVEEVKEIQKQVNEFVEIDCEYNSNEDKQMLIDTLIKLIYIN